MIVSTPHREAPYTASLDNSFSRIGRALAGGNTNTLVSALFAHDSLRDILIKRVIAIVNDECIGLCRRSQPSLFRKSNPSDYTNFKWSNYSSELELRSPVLFQLFKTVVSHGDHRNEKKKGDVHIPAVCMAVSVLLKERNREMVGIQTCVSLLLYGSRAQKQVQYWGGKWVESVVGLPGKLHDDCTVEPRISKLDGTSPSLDM